MSVTSIKGKCLVFTGQVLFVTLNYLSGSSLVMLRFQHWNRNHFLSSITLMLAMYMYHQHQCQHNNNEFIETKAAFTQKWFAKMPSSISWDTDTNVSVYTQANGV